MQKGAETIFLVCMKVAMRKNMNLVNEAYRNQSRFKILVVDELYLGLFFLVGVFILVLC